MFRGLLKMLPMDRPTRRLDHGSSRLRSYRGAFMSAPVLTLFVNGTKVSVAHLML